MLLVCRRFLSIVCVIRPILEQAGRRIGSRALAILILKAFSDLYTGSKLMNALASHPIKYQSAVTFHKVPQPDRLSLLRTWKTCPRCPTVTESSTICMPTTSRLTLTHQSPTPTFLQPVPHYKAVSLMLVTGVLHVDYSLTKIKQTRMPSFR